uniref:Uncharacterized protein n=1 Tax=Romanomermis culicivorax TaxID=13658 RepID=A0A915L6P7_ROMCU
MTIHDRGTPSDTIAQPERTIIAERFQNSLRIKDLFGQNVPRSRFCPKNIQKIDNFSRKFRKKADLGWSGGVISDKYCMSNLWHSVLPLPDSPLKHEKFFN